MPFRCTIHVRCGKSVQFVDSPDSTTNIRILSADSPGNVLGFNQEWCGMPRNVRIIGRESWHIYRDSPSIWCLCAFFSISFQLYVPLYVQIERMENFMCLLEFECAKRLKAHSQAIPAFRITSGELKSWAMTVKIPFRQPFSYADKMGKLWYFEIHFLGSKLL